ncbi:glutathione S-transferase kappa 1-like isoform X2 [Engystomops pustulosus]|uniref:glutathione S-transferase kappa 1-like isoform X2 n=1 Tax=Engystomops pustulosus TaxID=76066 RepID=UPI003AFB1A63
MSNRKVLELFYDVVSPYSWLGFEVLLRYKKIWNIDIHLRPGFLAGIINQSGNTAPALIPNKIAYMFKDVEMMSEFYQVPLRMPSDFFHVVMKKGSLSAMRFVTALQMSHPTFLEGVSRELWLRIWSEDKDITEAESILQLFGMPSIVAHINDKPELFFGTDRFELLAHRLGEKWLGPVPQKSEL